MLHLQPNTGAEGWGGEWGWGDEQFVCHPSSVVVVVALVFLALCHLVFSECRPHTPTSHSREGGQGKEGTREGEVREGKW